MNLTVDELVTQAEKLSVDDRELLLLRLQQKLAADPEADATWIAEVERRADGMDDGSRPATAWSEARQRLGLG